MKSFYLSWNRDSVETGVCLNQIMELSGGRLKPEIDDLLANGMVDEANPKDGPAGFRQRTNFVNRNNTNTNSSGGYRNNNRNQPPQRNNGGPMNKNRFNNNRKRPQ
ncbi:hypothetical protein D9M68_982810 [compost metagenome]